MTPAPAHAPPARSRAPRRRRLRPADRVCTTCGAYHFPHRQFGGRCSAQAWVAAFFRVGRRECSTCVNYTERQCEVLTGQEQPFHCPELRDHVRYEGIALYGRARELFDRSQRKAA